MNNRLLIVAALGDEVRIIRSKMVMDSTIHFKPAILYRGQYQNQEVDLLVTGMGMDRARKGLTQTLEGFAPKLILHVGYAGGTSPVAGLGCLVLADRVTETQSGNFFRTDSSLFEKAKTLCEEQRLSHCVGGIVTVSKVISSPHEKADIGATHGAIALDMEAAGISQIACARKIPFLVAKAVLDQVEMELPNFQDCIEATGETKPVKLVRRLFKNPKEMMALSHLSYNASQARSAVTQFVEKWMQVV